MESFQNLEVPLGRVLYIEITKIFTMNNDNRLRVYNNSTNITLWV